MNEVKIGGTICVGIIIISLLFGTFRSVGAGQVGVVTRFGKVNRVVYPGIAVKMPFIEGIHTMVTRTQKEQVDASSASKDLQEVKATIALNYHLDGGHAVDVYQNIGENYTDVIVAPAMQEAFKSTTAKFTAEDLIGNREAVKTQAYTSLSERLKKYNIIVDDFNIVNFDFSQDFNAAIEQKQVSQQNLEKAKIEAQTAITNARGQSDAQKLLKDTGSLSPEYLEYYALQKWNGILPYSTNGVPFITLPTK